MAMMEPLEVPPLGISEREAEIQFEKLQAKLIPLWKSISGLDPEEQDEQTVVIVPSQSIEFDCKGAEMQSYEERMLYLLMLLRQPRTRMIYVTSQTILPTTLDYYMSLMPGVITSHALQRFINIAPEDRSPRSLTTKVLERPHLCSKIRYLIPDLDRAYLVSYTVTMQERDLALRLASRCTVPIRRYSILAAKVAGVRCLLRPVSPIRWALRTCSQWMMFGPRLPRCMRRSLPLAWRWSS